MLETATGEPDPQGDKPRMTKNVPAVFDFSVDSSVSLAASGGGALTAADQVW